MCTKSRDAKNERNDGEGWKWGCKLYAKNLVVGPCSLFNKSDILIYLERRSPLREKSEGVKLGNRTATEIRSTENEDAWEVGGMRVRWGNHEKRKGRRRGKWILKPSCQKRRGWGWDKNRDFFSCSGRNPWCKKVGFMSGKHTRGITRTWESDLAGEIRTENLLHLFNFGGENQTSHS